MLAVAATELKHFSAHLFRQLCQLIGERTNVYSLEVSMNGREVPASAEKLQVFPDEKFEVEPYTVEDCKPN